MTVASAEKKLGKPLEAKQPQLEEVPLQYETTGSEIADKNLDEMSRQMDRMKNILEHIGDQLDTRGAG